jgi:hypothetical protein
MSANATNSLTPTASTSRQELIDMVQYLTKTNEHLVEEYQKLEKEVKKLQNVVGNQHATLQLHGLAEYRN